MIRPRKVQWADDQPSCCSSIAPNIYRIPKGVTVTTQTTRQLVHIKSYPNDFATSVEYEPRMPILSSARNSKTVQKRLDRNLSTVKEEDDDTESDV